MVIMNVLDLKRSKAFHQLGNIICLYKLSTNETEYVIFFILQLR